MNSPSSIDKNEIRDRLKSIAMSKSELQQIESDSLILQANYLSEIERLYKDNGLNRKELAQKIKTSPSYLTQVFRGDKPLNFITLAKIKRALGLQFEVQASFKSEKKPIIEYLNTNNSIPLSININRQKPMQVVHVNQDLDWSFANTQQA